ncbi:hypothetical protein [Escherichia fergusonii]|uniref:hypothetical protein n=1 Tax=Escherichia fergusonii TaxID=564 RepID=UPI0002F11B69|nr:hypothetical protein [Escherichia fergusonii]EHJ4091612.1 hypothetical protein [Escherichia fergusonii]EHJ4132834.1 hypothetical protein [Escherichia fergusonii]EHJ4140652.1 hypothetical protein [Escherichia fergusonii]EHT2453626.1 hypothetical protein [Escherichia fergusonii]EIH2137437.1 hypothetical protein [Escherichia fergusonii]
MAGETTDVNLVTTFFKKKYELKEDTGEKQSTENRQPLPCAAGDALPYFTQAESV